MKFDPMSSDGNGVAFNPLAEIRLGEFQRVADAQNIASILADPKGEGLESHWAKTGYALLTASILHCCYTKPTASLSDVDELLANLEKDLEEVLNDMLAHPHKDGKPHPLIAQEARARHVLGAVRLRARFLRLAVFRSHSSHGHSGRRAASLGFLTSD